MGENGFAQKSYYPTRFKRVYVSEGIPFYLSSKFSGLKCGERRRSGRKVLTQDMENLLLGCMLVSNLEHPDYVEIISGSLDKLPEAFAELDIQKSKGIGEQESNEEKINREQEKFETASLSTTERSFIRKCLIEENILAAASY